MEREPDGEPGIVLGVLGRAGFVPSLTERGAARHGTGEDGASGGSCARAGVSEGTGVKDFLTVHDYIAVNKLEGLGYARQRAKEIVS
jgi:hypothetical protein